MGSRHDSRPKDRLPLTRDRLLRAAIGVADTGGIGALSMRRLGHELGVEAMSLYNHVANKDDLLTAIVDQVEDEIALPDPGMDWKSSLRAISMSAHDVFERHPWAASLTLSGIGPRPARWRYMNAVLGCLRGAGFSPDVTDLAYHALESHVTGFTLWAGQLQLADDELPGLAEGFLAMVPADAMPHLVEHVHQHLKARQPEAPTAFTFGLDLILDGLERLLNEA